MPVVRVLFRRPLPERYGRLSTHTALQCSFPGGDCGPSGVDVLVALQSRPSLTRFTSSGEEPMDQLVAFDGGHGRLEIGHDGGTLAYERYPTEAGDQRFLALIVLHCVLEAGPWVRRGYRCSPRASQPGS